MPIRVARRTPGISSYSLTGSTQVGQHIGAEAGRHLKKVVLELGGSDPFIVLEDADLEFTAKGAVAGRMLTTGQSCIASKRFIVVAPVAEAFARVVRGEPIALPGAAASTRAVAIGLAVRAAGDGTAVTM